ncbi:MAG: NAD(P)/FAD-dependent oxidoreductase [Candidatus Omnitrophica bacterium]|nr:NAD(P)/FAD-dependent oxidoreductase [Candidatus Omnitrophota bacterium]
MYELAIIGAGAAGIACAKYALKAGLKTILIEESPQNFGGVCLNKGCIPTKFFINKVQTTKHWLELKNQAQNLIDQIKKPLLDFFEKNKIQVQWGKALFLDAHTLKVDSKKIEAKNIIIAGGSLPKRLGIANYKKIITADQFFEQDELPYNIAIIGGGYIGIEFATFLNLLGKKVTVIEKEQNILPTFDTNLSERLQNILEKKGITFLTDIDINKINLESFDIVIEAIGRYANIAELNLKNAGVDINCNGQIETNEFLQTTQKNIYCCGDITAKKMLAYTAEHQAYVCIHNILGKNIKEDYEGIAECVFSIPQIAKVGLQEKDLTSDSKTKYKLIKSNFLRFSSTYVYDDKESFIQIIVDDNQMIKGASVISKFSSDLISLFSLIIRKKIKISDLKNCFFVHPTIQEIIPSLFREL